MKRKIVVLVCRLLGIEIFEGCPNCEGNLYSAKVAIAQNAIFGRALDEIAHRNSKGFSRVKRAKAALNGN